MNYSIFKDINGDFCQKTLAALVVGGIWLILCVVGFFYALGHDIKSSQFILGVLGLMMGFITTVLTATAFQRIRGADAK